MKDLTVLEGLLKEFTKEKERFQEEVEIFENVIEMDKQRFKDLYLDYIRNLNGLIENN